MKVLLTCPLGHKCERRIDDDTIERCRWYRHLVGQNPQTGESQDEWDCALAWMPLLQVEGAMTNRGQTQAIESLRNIVAKQKPVVLVERDEAPKPLISNDPS